MAIFKHLTRAHSASFISALILATSATPAQAVQIKWGPISLDFLLSEGVYVVTELYKQITSTTPGFSLVNQNTKFRVQETPTEIVGVVSGFGEVSEDKELVPLSFTGDYWDFGALLTAVNELDLTGTSDDADSITITGTELVHKFAPPDPTPHGLADKLSLNVSYRADESGAAPGVEMQFTKSRTDSAEHRPHFDNLYYSRLIGTVRRDPQSILFPPTEEDWHILGFTYDFSAKHESSPLPESVPGPLPVLGLAAVFGYSRKLRKRLRDSKLPLATAID